MSDEMDLTGFAGNPGSELTDRRILVALIGRLTGLLNGLETPEEAAVRPLLLATADTFNDIDGVEFDDAPIISHGAGGAHVQAWAWVYFDDLHLARCAGCNRLGRQDEYTHGLAEAPYDKLPPLCCVQTLGGDTEYRCQACTPVLTPEAPAGAQIGPGGYRWRALPENPWDLRQVFCRPDGTLGVRFMGSTQVRDLADHTAGEWQRLHD